MKNNETHLCDLSDCLVRSHVQLELSFLLKLLQSASRAEKPWPDRVFSHKVGSVFNKKSGCATGIRGWKNGYRTIPMLKLIKIVSLSSYSWENVEQNLIFIKSGIKKGRISPKFPIRPSFELGRIVGHILGDGSINKRGESVFYSNSNPELLHEFIEDMHLCLGAEPRIWIQKKAPYNERREWLKRVDDLKDVPKNHPIGLFYPKICCDILKGALGNFADGRVKNITQEIKASTLQFKLGLVRAFFDDEGSVRSDDYTLRFHQDKKQLLMDIKSFLNELGINSNPVRGYYKRQKERYYFNITGFNSYCRFSYLIGCTSSRKKRELELLINKVILSRKFKNKLKELHRLRVTPTLLQSSLILQCEQ